MNDKKYIYNPTQAKYYIQNGIRVLDTGVHFKTKKVFWVFDYNDTKDVYLKWLNHCQEYKSIS